MDIPIFSQRAVSARSFDKVNGFSRVARLARTVTIVIRGDGGFCRENIMYWCESNDVVYQRVDFTTLSELGWSA